MGASAGTNMAAPTLRTTNDMPIVQPRPSRRWAWSPPDQPALPRPGSVLHAQGRDPRGAAHRVPGGERRAGARLREGSWLRVDGERATVEGGRPARLFRRGAGPRELRSAPTCPSSSAQSRVRRRR
ncbi:Type 1 glutamine amidotransferase-like domain-containing protein [Streptomyces sp. KL116D]|uniref:Type 1 glutamine amidotransferase-like domain-containing protein n=1 Tax=Streptomyces sp. KL116D TaxID=3045152 RepID=UPI0035565A97